MKNKLNYTNSNIKYYISEYVHSKRDRAIVSDHFVDGTPYMALADKYELSLRQVQTICDRAWNGFKEWQKTA